MQIIVQMRPISATPAAMMYDMYFSTLIYTYT